MGIRSSIAKGAGRASYWALKNVFHRTASHLPGRIALTIDPNLLSELAGKLRHGSVVVCGTNGKTTTTNVIAAAIESTGQEVLCNNEGANMIPGITGALLPGDSADWAILESDELSTIHVLPQLKPSYLLLLNLFRDQLDRAGEIEHIQDVIVDALAASPTTTLVANGDDPLCMGIARRAKQSGVRVLTFGIDEELTTPAERVAEAKFCQVCGSELEYHSHSYAQLGNFYCPNCDFCRPKLDFAATGINVSRTGIAFDVACPGVSALASQGAKHLEADFGGVYMVYNLLAAYAVASLAGTSAEEFQRTLETYRPENGRLQKFRVRGREVILNLAKNPAGFNQNISLMLADDRPKAAFFMVNDLVNDGRDVSWIWDMDLERLGGEDMRILCGGLRANDVQVRAKYAGLDSSLASDVSDAIAQVIDLPLDQPLYVLANYSALFPAKDELEKIGERYE